MINSVHLKNFRSLEDTGEISLHKLTILLGKNSIGKSSFLRSFPLFQQSLLNNRTEPVLWYTPDLVDFGSYNDTKRLGTPENTPISFSFNLNIKLRRIFRRQSTLSSAFARHGHIRKNDEVVNKNQVKSELLINEINKILKRDQKEVPLQFDLNLYEHYAQYVIFVFNSKIVIHHEYKDNESKKIV